MALRALDEGLRLEPVVGAALVAARLRRLSLGNGHERVAVYLRVSREELVSH